MLRLNETAALLDPVDVDLLRKIVPEEDHDDQDETHHEGGAGEIVYVLRRLRDARERIRADHRQQPHLAEGDIQAGQAKHDERLRRQPMPKSFNGLEAKNLPTG